MYILVLYSLFNGLPLLLSYIYIMKLDLGIAMLPTVTNKSAKSSKTRKGSCEKDSHIEVAYILKFK